MPTVLAENQLIQSSNIYGFSVRGFNNSKKIKLPALCLLVEAIFRHQRLPVDGKTAKVKEVFDMNAVLKVLASDFLDSKQDNSKPKSRNDKKFISKMTKGIRITDGQHFEMPLPFKDSKPSLPYNKEVAKKRLGLLRKRFQWNPNYYDYTAFMKDIFGLGYAEKLSPSERTPKTPGSVWYIPHHGVNHPQKPGKIRVVFDCSAKCQGICLNNILQQSPDLIIPLIGVFS